MRETLAARATALRKAHHLPSDAAVPDELVLASGSGLDPQISAAAARFQLQRVCAARGIDEARVSSLIGSKLVNVFALNRQLDAMEEGSTR